MRMTKFPSSNDTTLQYDYYNDYCGYSSLTLLPCSFDFHRFSHIEIRTHLERRECVKQAHTHPNEKRNTQKLQGRQDSSIQVLTDGVKTKTREYQGRPKRQPVVRRQNKTFLAFLV